MRDAKALAATLKCLAHGREGWGLSRLDIEALALRDAAALLEQQAEQLAQAKAENQKLRDVQIIMVAMPDGSDVAAPCAIEGCQYARLEAQLEQDAARIKELEVQLEARKAHS